MHSFPFILPILIYLVLAVLGVAISIYLIFFLRTATRYLDLKIKAMENKHDHQP